MIKRRFFGGNPCLSFITRLLACGSGVCKPVDRYLSFVYSFGKIWNSLVMHMFAKSYIHSELSFQHLFQDVIFPIEFAVFLTQGQNCAAGMDYCCVIAIAEGFADVG